MAASKSAQNPYQWPDGSWHSITAAQHQANQQGGTVAIGSTPVTTAQWQSGALVNALAPGGAPAGTTPQPYDPSTDEAALTANRNVALGNADADTQIGNLGFDAGYNLDGSVNTANPYSRAALYQLAHDNQQRSANTGFSNNGQLFSGAYGQQRNLNDQAYARNDAANRLAYQRGVQGLQRGKLTNYANAGSSVSDADFSSLLKQTYPSSGG